MFLGTYEHAIDAKGRVSVPKKFLEHFREPGQRRMFFATKGFDRCIALYTSEGWDAAVAKVRKNQMDDDEAHRAFKRTFFSLASELEVDSSGRVLLPAKLRASAEIGDDAVFVGVDDHLEIWSAKGWKAHEERHETRFEEHAKGIFRA